MFQEEGFQGIGQQMGKQLLTCRACLLLPLSPGYEGDQLEEMLSRHSGSSPSTDVLMEKSTEISQW